MNARAAALALTTLLAGACTVGPTLSEFKPAHNPAGVQSRVTLHRNILDGNKVSGELLAARNDGVLLLSPEPVLPDTSGTRLVLVPFWMMRSIRLEQVGTFAIRSEGADMDAARKTRLRLLSRYPQGVSDELLTKLLAGLSQDAIDVPARQD